MRSTLNVFVPFAFGVLGALAGNALLTSQTGYADGLPRTDGVPRYLAYSGTLELDGSPVSVDQMPMRFTIWRGATPALIECWVAAPASGCAAATAAVPVYGGRFSVGIGRFSPPGTVEQIFANADGLELGIEIGVQEGGGAIEWIPLAGRQAFTPVPWAFWSSNATDLVVSGNDSDGSVGPLSVFSGSDRLTLDGNEIDSNNTLLINSNTTRAVELGGALSVAGASTLVGTINAGRATAFGQNVTVAGTLGVTGLATMTGGFTSNANSSVNGALTAQSILSNTTITSNGNMTANGLLTAAAQLSVTGSADNNGVTAPLRIVRTGETMLIDGDEIDTVGDTLRLNTNVGFPVQIPVIRTQVSEYNDNGGPEAYRLVMSGVNAMTYPCSDTTRGSLIVANLEDKNQDGLCACLRVEGAFEWWCFNP